MTEVIEVDYEELSKKAIRMQNSLERVSELINYLYSDVLYKIGDEWKSKDNYEYLNNLTDYLDDLKVYYNSIQNYIAFLNIAKDEYYSTLESSMILANSL